MKFSSVVLSTLLTCAYGQQLRGAESVARDLQVDAKKKAMKTMNPTATPTKVPIAMAPSNKPTTKPVKGAATKPPTKVPTMAKPTKAPVAPPTEAPVAPVAAPVVDPTEAPVAAPVADPTEAPVSPTLSPTPLPTVLQRDASGFAKCDPSGMSKFPNGGKESSERLLLRENVIKALPKSLCGGTGAKNVILVIGDGMGWEMVRAGAITRRVLDELKSLGIDTVNGSPGTAQATAALAAFQGRTLKDYYTEGKGSGLSFQNELENMVLVTTTTTVIQAPEAGNHYAPSNSLLKGSVNEHNDGMSSLALNDCGHPVDFSPLDYELEGGNMVLWNDEYGGKYPWDSRYFGDAKSGKFDPTYIMQHATDSANTAGTIATGHKASVNMISVDLYEDPVSTIVEDAMKCGKSGGVVTSVPILHATPAAFVTHTNSRTNNFQLAESFRTVNPTYASGTCGTSTSPSEKHKTSMLDGGSLSSQWTFLYQGKNNATAANFYDPIQSLDPDDDKHVLVCLGSQYTASKQQNLPFRGVDSGYTNRWCSSATAVKDANGVTISYIPNSKKCDHYSAAERAQIPVMSKNVEEALKFLAKDNDGFFMMYEQGDIDWSAHSNHMDDMLGTLLDIDDGVKVILNWIKANGGWEKNALYVTADHDHYLTLNNDFPEILAKRIILGESHNITPERNSNANPWSAAVSVGRHNDTSKSQIDHIKDFTTWTDQDIKETGHFWGAAGSGGNGWGSHSTRPVPMYYMGDGGCVEAFVGKGFQVLGREVKGVEGKIDQMHIHACMMKNLFGLQ